MNLRKFPMILLILASLNLISVITAPFTISPNTIKGVNGNAITIDHFALWDDLNPYACMIYTFGDFNCHQMESRSFFLNDNQMPVCARCTGLAFGFLIGSVLFIFTIPNSNPFLMALTLFLGERVNFINKKKAIALSITIVLIFMLPLAIDGLLQVLTNYESINAIRYVTGLLFGWVVVLCLGVYLESYIYKHIYEKKIAN